MNLCRCEKGHFYDKEKFPTCPHCNGGSASDDSLTTVFTEDVTEPIDAVQQSVGAMGVPQFDTPTSALPIADLPIDQATVAMDFNDMDSVTVPLTDSIPNPFDMPSSPVGEASDDDDHTVGFFDDDFFGTPATSQAPSSAPASAAPAKPVVNKVNTPCVGWLVALGGAHVGTDFRLKVGKNFIGRNPQMDVALVDDKSVSRDRQAIVVYEPKQHLYLVQPGEASTLVYKNNEVVLSPVKLEAYDVITVGEVNLLFIPLCNKEFNWSDLLEEKKKAGK